jgi:hypothetical protein
MMSDSCIQVSIDRIYVEVSIWPLFQIQMYGSSWFHAVNNYNVHI